MNDQRSHPPAATVVHASLPGEHAADPRDRQVARRLVDLVSLGLDVSLVPIESQRPGGAPRALESIGIRIVEGPREPAVRRLRRVAAGAEVLILTTLAVPSAVLDAAIDSDAVLVLDLEHLPSARRVTGRPAFRPTEMDGLDTEIDHLRRRERRVLEHAALVICDSADTAADVHELVRSSVSVPVVRVVAPTGPRPRHATAPAAASIVVPGRFSDEFATPDESALHRLLSRWTGVATDAELVLAAEDTLPHLRHGVNGRIATVPLLSSCSVAASAIAAADLRSYGLPTTARRIELSAAGVPFVASTAAMGSDRLEGAIAQLVTDDPEHQVELLVRLCSDGSFRASASAAVLETVEAHPERRAREQLADAFAAAGLVVGPPQDPAPRFAVAPGEYHQPPVDGTLADADPRIAELEREMVPFRLHRREDSINLQSTMDADQRYRVFARTHLDAPPTTDPVEPEGAKELTFSILVPTYNTDPALLGECIDSVVAQTHDNWELCIVDDGSPVTDHLEVLKLRADSDPRIKVQLNPYNQGIALATNDALAMARGDWVVLLDHDDVLKLDALAWVATYAERCPDYDLWYSDEDKIGLDGRLVMPFFKPDWSPDLLLGVNYVCHLLSVRRELIEQVGGFRAGFDGAQDYDLVLRMVERARRVGHIAKPLYSWRMIEGSTALDTGAKPKAHLAGHQALTDALGRRFEPGTVEDGQADTTHIVRRSVDTDQLLTVMIPTRDRVDLLEGCIERLHRATGGVQIELLIVDNHSSDPETLRYLDRLVELGHQVVRYPHEFSFARQINLGALHARGDLLLVLNNDALSRNDDWLLRMMEHAQRPEVGLVGARLMFPPGQRDGRPQHEGIVMGMAGLAYNVDLGGYMGLDQFVRNCSSVTAACVMMRTSVFFAVGGMEERLRVAYNDVDFGLRVSEMGYRVVYTPHAVLEHPESASRGSMHPMEDEEWLIERWGPKGAVREPFVNPHFEWLMPVFYRL